MWQQPLLNVNSYWWKTNPPTLFKPQEEATTYHQQYLSQGGRAALLFHYHSLSCLSLNSISQQLTKCHASEGSLISSVSQTFYLSILLFFKKVIFLPLKQQKLHIALLNFLWHHMSMSDFSLG